jgi:hypothetical protein
MKNYILALGALALMASCSSEPSDFRPGQKVSVDAVSAGGRKTGIYPSDDRPGAEGHAAHAEGHGEAHGEGHTDGEMHDADAGGAAATGSEDQKSAVSNPATEEAAEPAAHGE